MILKENISIPSPFLAVLEVSVKVITDNCRRYVRAIIIPGHIYDYGEYFFPNSFPEADDILFFSCSD